MRLLLIFTTLLFSQGLLAQIIIENDQSVEWYVENVLLGGGVTAENITLNGVPADQIDAQCGFFNSENANAGLDEGMIIASGNIVNAVGPNNTGSSGTDMGTNESDPDLALISGFDIFDAAILEFDFVPQGDTLSFNYVFASDEYPEFVGAGVNDAFGFFVAGPGLSGIYSSPAGFPDGSVNIALIPGTTTPVSIDDVNEASNSIYYLANGDGFEAPYDADNTYIQYDGLTVPLTAITEVQCGETYHIKIVIGDAGDGIYDSAVFLEAGSFSSNLQVQANLEFDINESFTENTLYEGCFEGTLVFERFSNIPNAFSIDLAVTGTATNGVDYTEIPTTLTFLPGDSIVSFTVSAFLDALPEGTETVTLEILTNQNLCGTDEPSYFTFEIADSAPPVILEDQVLNIDCNESIDIGAIAEGGFGMFYYTWSTGEEGDSITVSPSVTTTYTLTVQDSCVTAPGTADFIVNVAAYPDVTLDISEDSFVLECGETGVAISSTADGGSQPLDYQWIIGGLPDSTDPDLTYEALDDVTISLVVTDQCGSSAVADALVDVIPYTPPVIDLQPLYQTDCVDPEVLISPLSASGGQGEWIYEWSFDGALVSDQTEVNAVTSVSVTEVLVSVTVTDECDISSSDNSTVEYVPAPAIEITLPAGLELICDDPTVVIDPISITGGQDNNVTSVWFDEAGASLGAGASLTTATGVNTQYDIVVTDICGYEASASIPVIVIPYTPMTISTIGDTIICAGTPAIVSSGTSGGLEPILYNWNLGLPSTQTVTISPLVSELLTVEATDQCGFSVSGNVLVSVAEVHALFDISMEEFYGFETNNLSSYLIDPITSYAWYIDQDLISQENDITMQFADIDDHIVSLVVLNSAGCRDSVGVQTLGPPTMYVPNSFTPDDDGVNDLFFVKGSNIVDFEMKIYDRWGNVVFESFEMGKPWNGASRADSNYRGDSELFAYRIIARGRDGEFYEKEGTIMMVR